MLQTLLNLDADGNDCNKGLGIFISIKGKAMDIFRELRRDHEEAHDALAAWLRRPTGAAGDSLWGKWTHLWDVHVRVEENFLFPFLKDEPVLRRLISEAADAHGRIRKSIRELPSIPVDSRAWNLAVQDLTQSLMLSFELEENHLIPLARQILAPEEARDLGREVQDFLRGLRLALSSNG
jgi:hypothetical protein